jgi:hypothetical protein
VKILAIERDLRPLPEARRSALLLQEARAVWELQQSAVLREIYFHRDRPQAVLVLECGGEMEARTVLGTLPLVAEGYTAFEVYPLVPYPGFARLFGGIPQ